MVFSIKGTSLPVPGDLFIIVCFLWLIIRVNSQVQRYKKMTRYANFSVVTFVIL